jgi:hypothetical protein
MTFDGIYEKLKRANENIVNLKIELDRFIQEGEYSILVNPDDELMLKATAYHRQRVIPPRFSVLSGEIVHHLRSCLDHIVWLFSDPAYRTQHRTVIEFPILKTRPSDKDRFTKYERKIEGIGKTIVRDMIGDLQPYKSVTPTSTFLWVIHNMNITDKHQELITFFDTAQFIPNEPDGFASYQREHPELDPMQVARHFQRNGKFFAQVSFREFGGWAIQPIIPGLQQLADHTSRIVGAFEKRSK